MKYRPFDYNGDFSQFSVEPQEIKESLTKEDRRLVELNIAYPKPKAHYFEAKSSDRVSAFYKKIADNFASYARKRLFSQANQFIKSDEMPFSAVMKYIPTYENDALISIVIDAFVFYNEQRSITKRLAHIFLKTKFGLLTFNDFFTKEEKVQILDFITSEYLAQGKLPDNELQTKEVRPEVLIRKHFNERNLFLTPNGYAFFFDAGTIMGGTMPQVYIIPYGTIATDKTKFYISSNQPLYPPIE